MKQFLLFVLCFYTLDTFAQTVTGDRVIARQGFYLNGKWVDSVQKSGSFTSDRTTPTSKAIANGAIKNQFINFSEPDFEIDVIPDIQFMNSRIDLVDDKYHKAGRSIFQWIANNKTSENIKFALQVGDITDQGTTPEWDTASSWFNILDAANVSYVAAMGNHDWDSGGTWGVPRLANTYNQYFGASRMGGKPYYAGFFTTDPENQGFANSYYKFDIGSKKYYLLSLEFLPRDTVVGWANRVLDSLYQADPTREVMILTHAYMTIYGELAKDSSRWTGDSFASPTNYNSGQSLWDKLIKKKPNIRWVFSGHYISDAYYGLPFQGRVTAVGENGNTIEQLFANWQSDVDGGEGYFTRLKFRPSQNKVDVSFYSDYEHQYSSLIKGFAINEPPLILTGDIGTNGNVSVNQKLRVAGSLNVESLSKGRIPFIGEDHKLKDTSTFRFNLDSFYVKALVYVDSSLRVKGYVFADSLKAPSGVFGINNSRFQMNNGTPQFGTTGNMISLWRNDIATTTSPSFNKVMEINSYSTFLDGSSGGFHPNALLARAYDLTGTSISYSTGYQDNVFGLFIGAGFDTKTGVSSSAITAGTTPTQALGMNMYKFVNQGSGTRTINGFVANAKFALNCTASGSITSYADIVAGISSGISAAITNRYAFYADDVSDANVTNAYGFYQAGANTQNHFAGKTTFGSIINLPSSTAPTSSADSSGVEGDIKRDASGNLYLRTSTQWLKFTGSTF